MYVVWMAMLEELHFFGNSNKGLEVCHPKIIGGTLA